ncbi:hypothetical protein Ciccas_013354 [Cichlidogyrus casuarinus]|uniref:SOCS box domain-containing protein n=1 Tax=Cichlidogyrus casuarinus TaxID=1844966 RepID=A0ABD2PLB4_9PLAT
MPGWQRLSSSSKQRFCLRQDGPESAAASRDVQHVTTTSSSLCGATSHSLCSAPLSASTHLSTSGLNACLKASNSRPLVSPAGDEINLPCHPYTLTNARAKVNIDKQDKIGMTALMIAAEAGTSGLNMFQSLLDAGAELKILDKMSMTALHYACYVGALSTVRCAFEHPVFCLGSTNSSKNCSSSNQIPVLPVQANLTGSAAFLCTSRTSLLANDNTATPIHSAAVKKTAYDLLNTQDKYGRTPMYLATARGHTDVVNYLLSLGADIHIANKESKSPLYISAYFGHLDIVDQADSHHKTPLYVATYHGRFDIVELLLAAGASVNAVDKNGKTALYIAVLHGHLALANKLLSAGASVNHPDHEGLGPLHMAVKFPKLDLPMIKLLLKHGCDPVNLAAFTRWLLAHGIISDEYIEGDPELKSWLHLEESNVKSLKRLCRQEIQRALGKEESMGHKIARLPLPDQLRSYVSMKAL